MPNTVYTVSIKFTEDFMEDYHKIKTFETHYRERLMKVQAMPEKTENDIRDKNLAHELLQAELEEISSIFFTKDSYDMRNFYDEVMIEFNTYSQHDAINDVFLFEDSFTPMFVFAYIAKVYPKLLEYLTEYTLTKDGVELVNFMNLL